MILRKTVTGILEDSIQCDNIQTSNIMGDINVGDIAHISKQEDGSWLVIDYEPEYDVVDILHEKGYNVITVGLRFSDFKWNTCILTYRSVVDMLSKEIKRLGFEVKVTRDSPSVRAIEFINDDFFEFEKQVLSINERSDSL